MLQKFTTRDLILIASLAGMGFVAKILISPLFKMISMPMMVPGGSLAGGFYMLWLVLAVLIVPKWGTGLLFGLLLMLLLIRQELLHAAVYSVGIKLPSVLRHFLT